MKASFDHWVAMDKAELRQRVHDLPYIPTLVILNASEDPASQTYLRSKKETLGACGIQVEIIERGPEVTTEELVDFIQNSNVADGIMLQLPVYDHIDAQKVIEAIPEGKDVDRLTPQAQGLVASREDAILPCTVQGIMDTLKRTKDYKPGTPVLVMGRSLIVGTPLVNALIRKGYTVTCHNSHSRISSELDFFQFYGQFDVIVTATGQHGAIRAEYVEQGQLLVDVGINRVQGKLVGDVKHTYPSAAAITPVPGGIGRLTVVNLGLNLVKLIERNFE